MRKTLCFVVAILLLPGFLPAQDKVKDIPVPTAVRTVYLTFDDGPLEGSEKINDVIKQDKIKIDVFVVGSNIKSSKRLTGYLQLYDTNPWIEVGNHSYSHAHDNYQNFYKDPESALQDFLLNEKTLRLSTRIARLPGRNMWRVNGRSLNDVKSGSLVADKLSTYGYKVFGWDLEWFHDPRTGVPIQTVEDMLGLINNHFTHKRTFVENHLVILCHDEMFRKGWEESELKQLIDQLRNLGYRFGHLGEYP